jgi:uncharacterized protein involved in exopolysaccharide biosynthesis
MARNRVSRHVSRRILSGLVAFVAVFIGSCLVMAILPPLYRSEAKVYVRLGRESATVDPTAAAGQLMSTSDWRVFEINSILELLSSEELKRRVIEEVGADRILGHGTSKKWSLGDGLAFLNPVHLNPLQSYSQVEDAVEYLERKLDIETTKNSNVVSLRSEAKSSELARDILKALIAAAQGSHLRVKQSQGSEGFFADQLEQSHQQLRAAEEQLRSYRTKTGIVDFVSQRDLLLAQVSALEQQLRGNEAELAGERKGLEACEQLRGSTERMVVVEEKTGQPQTAYDGMRQQLYSLQITQQALQSRLTNDHVLLKQIADQIEESKKSLAQEPDKKQVTLGMNATYQSLDTRMSAAQTTSASLDAKCSTLRRQLEAARAEVDKLLVHHTELAELERSVTIAEDRYRTYAKQFEQTRVDGALQLEKISNINVLQPPTLVATPVRPDPRLTLPAGVLLGVLAAVFVVFRRPAAQAAIPIVRIAEPSTAEELADSRDAVAAPHRPR